jgi:hypothetical protein
MTEIQKDETAVKNADTKATNWVATHAHQIVTGALVLVVLFILYKIL